MSWDDFIVTAILDVEVEYLRTWCMCSLQMGEQNIMVTNVCPGPVQTSVDVNAFNPDGSKYNRTDPMISNGMTSKRCCFFFVMYLVVTLCRVYMYMYMHMTCSCCTVKTL